MPAEHAVRAEAGGRNHTEFLPCALQRLMCGSDEQQTGAVSRCIIAAACLLLEDPFAASASPGSPEQTTAINSPSSAALEERCPPAFFF